MEGFYSYGKGPYDFSIRGGWSELSDETFSGTKSGAAPAFSWAEISGPALSNTVRASPWMERSPSASAPTWVMAMMPIYVPVGFSLGRRFDLENSKTTFTPYAHPVIVPTFGGGDSNVDFALGLGVDMRFSQNFGVRVSGGVGDIEGLGIAATYIK